MQGKLWQFFEFLRIGSVATTHRQQRVRHHIFLSSPSIQLQCFDCIETWLVSKVVCSRSVSSSCGGNTTVRMRSSYRHSREQLNSSCRVSASSENSALVSLCEAVAGGCWYCHVHDANVPTLSTAPPRSTAVLNYMGHSALQELRASALCR